MTFAQIPFIIKVKRFFCFFKMRLGQVMVARRIDPPVECPTCGSPVPDSARFCPVCQRPRRAVEQQLRQAADATGTPYETLLQRARDEDARDPQPFITPVAIPANQANNAPVRSKPRSTWKPLIAVFVAVILIVAIALGGDSDSGGSDARRPVSCRSRGGRS